VFFSECNGVFRDHCLASRGVSGYKNGIPHFEVIYSLFLERIELKRILEDGILSLQF
jgi:hypothetical protein